MRARRLHPGFVLLAVAVGCACDPGGNPSNGGRDASGPESGTCIPAARDCTSALDNDCSGVPDQDECVGCETASGGQAGAGDTEACFTFAAPAMPTGVCASGTKTCTTTADKTALVWGACIGETGPTSAVDSCDPSANGDENCDGEARDGCPCQPSDAPMPCGSCGGTQTCGADFQWGACSVPTPGNLGAACDAGCGTIQCNGQCSTSGHGGACGSCGGVLQCNGQCSVPTPGNLGAACGSCGGTVQCNGGCSVVTPGNIGQSCGSCGGHVQCNGSCSVATPGNFGQSCGSCGGTVQCNGSCSVATPGNYGQACGSCGGTRLCNGNCSVGTPVDYGQACNQCGTGAIQCNGQCSQTCIEVYDGPSTAVGWGWCAPYKYGQTATVHCPSGTQPVRCGIGPVAGFWGTILDDGDNTSRIYNGQGEIDARWDGNGCYVYIRAFNCEATTVFPQIVCDG